MVMDKYFVKSVGTLQVLSEYCTAQAGSTTLNFSVGSLGYNSKVADYNSDTYLFHINE